MLKETDFESVRAATKSLLYVSPQPCEDIPFIVYHPIFKTNIVLLPHDNHPYDILDINIGLVENIVGKRSCLYITIQK